MNEQKSRLKTVPGVAGESASFGGATFFYSPKYQHDF
jgi:hypothetical protein